MPADASIYGQIAQPQSNNLLKNYADVLAIQQGQQTEEMNRMKMADYARSQARQNKLLELSSQFGPDATDEQRIGTLKNAGFYDEADKLTTSNLARQKAGAEVKEREALAGKADMERATKRIDLIGQAFGALRQAPTLENAHGVIDFLQQSGVYSPEQAQAMKAKASSDPSKIAQGADIAFLAALDAKSQLPQILSANTGNAQTTTAIDPVTGKPIAGAGQSLPIMQSPDNAATNERMAADSAASRALTKRGQDLTNQRAIDANAAGGKPPAGYRWKPDGTLEAIPGGPAAKEGNLSEGERKAATLLRRLEGSMQQLDAALVKNSGAAKPEMLPAAVGVLPWSGPAANAMTSEARQQVEAAQLDMLDAALTLGTGAAYTREQLEGYRKSYFPQVGDEAATVADKQARLKNVIESAKIAAGRAASKGGVATGGWRIEEVKK